MTSPLLAELPSAPQAEEFPAFPASWYRFCSTRELGRGPVSKKMLGRNLVAWRPSGGAPTIMDANCSHLGADLSCGRIAGGALHCPFHNWAYGGDGRCKTAPGEASPPAFARQRTYPAVERHGHVFVFNGPVALFPLPFVIGADPADYAAGKLFSYSADTSWYMNAAHAFDTQHFQAVHDRRLLEPPAIDCPSPYARRNSYRAEVLGHTRLDRLLRAGAGKVVEITLTVWGGTFCVITGRFNRATSQFLMVTRPLDAQSTLCEGIVLAPKPHTALGRTFVLPIMLAVRRFFTFGYLRDEANHIRETRYCPGSLGEADRDAIDYFRWVAALPQSANAPAALPTLAPAGCPAASP